MGNQLPHILAFKDKGYILKMSHGKLLKSSLKHTFLRGTSKEQKQQTA